MRLESSDPAILPRLGETKAEKTLLGASISLKERARKRRRTSFILRRTKHFRARSRFAIAAASPFGRQLKPPAGFDKVYGHALASCECQPNARLCSAKPAFSSTQE